MTPPSLVDQWRSTFGQALQSNERSEPLRDAAVAGKLAAWTRELTALTVAVCREMGWESAAIGHQLGRLAIPRCEYLALDVMAFDAETDGWRYPVAIFELENSKDDRRIAYSLWKLLCVRADLRVVFCYRPDPEQGKPLVNYLRDEVVGALSNQERQQLQGDAVIVVGSRNEAETFPYGFFRWWLLDKNTGQFQSA